MAEQVEILSFDLRYEGLRMRSSGTEEALLLSILKKGIRDPLQGVETKGVRILLDGFKRLRCAKKLGIGIVPYASMGADEVLGIMTTIEREHPGPIEIDFVAGNFALCEFHDIHPILYQWEWFLEKCSFPLEDKPFRRRIEFHLLPFPVGRSGK